MVIVAAIAFLILATWAATLIKKALAALTPDEKARFVDASTATPIYWSLITVALFAAWIWIIYRRPQFMAAASGIGLAAVLSLFAINSLTAYGRYRAAALPASFLRTFLLTRAMRFLGAALLFLSVGLTLFRR
jgi:hypothetical protein